MNLLYIYNRTKDILFNPQLEWLKIKSEVKENYQLQLLIFFSILYVIGAILGHILFDRNNLGFGFNFAYILFLGINSFLLLYLGTYFSVSIVHELYINFGGERNKKLIYKIIINALIPFYLFTTLAALFPQLSVLFTVLSLYSLYIYWIGINHLLSLPQEKKMAYLILSSLLVILIFFLLRFILGSIIMYFSDSII